MRGPALVGLGLLVLGATSHSHVAAQTEAGAGSVEEQGRALVREFYARVVPPTTLNTIPDSCEGVSLVTCFAGDPDCTPPFGLAPDPRECRVPEVLEERGRLLERLDSLVRLDPASDWLVGQSVYLAMKNGDPHRATEIASRCEATRWWCLALQGYAKHQAMPGSGGVELAMALEAAPDEQAAWAAVRVPEAGDRGIACEWTDLTPLLPDTLILAEYVASGRCGERQAFEERFWWLADPMWSVPGNVRLDEHIVRNIQARLRDELLRVIPDRYWSDPNRHWPDPANFVTYHTRDRHTDLVRTGHWNSWRAVSFVYSRGGGAVYRYSPSGHLMSDTIQGTRYLPPSSRHTRDRYRVGYTHGGYSFAPDHARWSDPVASMAADWNVRWDEGHERMITRGDWHNLDHQIAVLLRGDSLLVAAAARTPVLLGRDEAPPQGALALGRPADLHLEVVPAPFAADFAIRATSTVAGGGWVASLEVQGDGWSGRARHGAPAPSLTDGFGVSTPVLVDDRVEPVRDRPLHEVLLPGSDLGGRERVGVYMEVYGVASDELLDMRLLLEPLEMEVSLLARIGGLLRLRPRTSSAAVRLAWTEPAEMILPGVSAHHVTIDTRSAAAGTYQLVIEVGRESGEEVRSSERVIQIRRR